MHCTIFLSAYSCSFAIDHAEAKLLESTGHAQAKILTNLGLIKAIPGAFNQCSLSFIFKSLLYILVGCALC
jgi:hypothetical protein